MQLRSMFCGFVLWEKPAEGWNIIVIYCLFTQLSLTLVGVHTDLLPEHQRLFDVFFLDTLDSKVWEGTVHCLCEFHCANPLLASLLPNQIVRVRSIWSLVGYTRDDNNCPPFVAGHLDGGKCAVLEGRRGPRNAAGTATLAFVPEPQPLTGGLLHHCNIGRLLHLVKVAASCNRRASVWCGHGVGGEIARLVTRAQNINCKGMKLDLKITLQIALQCV